MGLAQFRRRFQVLDPPLLKKLALTSEGLDERKVRAVGSRASRGGGVGGRQVFPRGPQSLFSVDRSRGSWTRREIRAGP